MKFYFTNDGTHMHKIKEYLVQMHDASDNSVCASMKNANEIIDMIDMEDCYADLHFEVFDVETHFGIAERLEVHGTWHDSKNPLYIKVTHSDGRIEFDGYGTDH